MKMTSVARKLDKVETVLNLSFTGFPLPPRFGKKNRMLTRVLECEKSPFRQLFSRAGAAILRPLITPLLEAWTSIVPITEPAPVSSALQTN
jgi:hypothetical protein